MGLRDQLFAEGPAAPAGGGEATPLVPNAVTDDVVWDCVTCGACVEACPVSIEHIDHIVDLRRHLVMVDARFPAEADPMLRDVERSSNPWGKAAVRAGRVGGGARRARARAGRPGARGPVLGRLRGLVRRAGRRRRPSRRRSCSRRPASTSRSSGRARRAPATRPGGWGTSTSSRRSPSRTSRR